MSAGRLARALLLATSLSVAGCGSPAVSVVPPSATETTPATEATPATETTPATEATPVPAVGGLREVAVAELPIGAAPAGGDDGPIRITPGTLHVGDLVWVLRADDPDRAAHLVAAVAAASDEATLPFGWVSAELGGGPTLREARVTCPGPAPTIEALAGLEPLVALACFGSRPMTFTGFTPIGCGAGGSPRTGTPDWLNGTWSGLGIGNAEPVPPDFAVEASILARAAPALGLEPCGQPGWYRFVGHFDDPASVTCRTETMTPDGTAAIDVEPLLSELLCRTHLVVTDATRQEAAP